MFVKIVRDLVPHLPEKFRRAELEYLKVIQGKSRIEPRWKECLREVDTYQPVSQIPPETDFSFADCT
jgi:predicted metalloendopeptidase